MDRMSYTLIFLIGILGAIVFTSYLEFSSLISFLACVLWGYIVYFGAVKIDTFVGKTIKGDGL